MTAEELSALIKDEIGEDARLHAILDRIRDGKANLTDSELYAAITAEITARQMRRNVLSLDGREDAFVDITRQRHSDTFTVFSAVQRILDAENGIHIKPQKPPFEEGRAHKIGHSLEDKTVPDSTIERRAESATENFCRSHHDDCMKVNAQFRDRAGMTSYIIRDGSAKCCDWCADVSGKYTLDSAPAGIWGRHDNCKCSIQYDAKKGGRQLLRGTSKKWEVVAPDAGAGALHRLSGAEGAGAGEPVVLTEEQAKRLQEKYQLHIVRNSVVNQARVIDIFNDHDAPSDAKITAQSIMDDLSTSTIGREILSYMENLPERVLLDYHTEKKDVDGKLIRGEEYGGLITIYVRNCDNSERAARTLIHECTHLRYGIGGSQWAECVCFAQELKHKYKRDNLTYSEKKRIIEAVQEGYPQYQWRIGGTVYGKKTKRRSNH